ncbi:MAG TPA: YfiR family protein [Terriglobales bacterium]|nr:YfiR family protein [Terriglobales bacterium]
MASIGAILLVLLYAPFLSSAQSGPTDVQVMAAFLYNFTNFTEWPDAKGSPNAAYEICFWGSGIPVADALEALANGRTPARPVVIRRFASASSLKSCQIVFFDQDSKAAAKVMESLGQAPVLTVGDIPDFAIQGGIIEFVIESGHVKLKINLEAAKKARLKISSRLLALSRIVPRPGPANSDPPARPPAPPKAFLRIEPIFPAGSIRIAGPVVLSASVDESRKPAEIQIASGNSLPPEAAIAGFARGKYQLAAMDICPPSMRPA